MNSCLSDLELTGDRIGHCQTCLVAIHVKFRMGVHMLSKNSVYGWCAAISLAITSFSAFAAADYISGDGRTELGVSIFVETIGEPDTCASKYDFLYFKETSDMDFIIHSPQMMAVDDGSSDYTKTSKYCAYKFRIQYNPGWQVRLKKPIVRTLSAFEKNHTLGDNPVSMNSRLLAKFSFNQASVLDNGVWTSCSFCYDQIVPARHLDQPTTWTSCADTELEIDLTLQSRVEYVSGSGVAKAAPFMTSSKLEWRKCN